MNEIQRLIHEMCPDGVPMVALGEICEIRGRIGFRGYTRADQVAEGEGALSLSPGNISNGVMDYSKGTYITWKKYEESPEIITENGDIIFCKTASCGKVAIVKNLPYKATINPQLVVLKNVSCSIPYLYYVLSSNSIQECVKKLQGVGSVPNISQAALSSFQIPLPPLPIQQRIVEILDKFTSLVSSLDSEIALRQKQYEYYRNKLLSFEEGEEGVEWKKISEVCSYVDYRGKTPTKTNKGVFLVTAKNIRMGFIDYNNSQEYITQEDYQQVMHKGLPQVGDVLITTEAPCGNVAQVDRADIALAQRVIKYRADENILLNSCLKYILMSKKIQDKIKSIANGGTVKGVKGSTLFQTVIPIPPLPVQLSIVRTLDLFESLLTNLKKERELRQKQYEYYREKLLTFA